MATGGTLYYTDGKSPIALWEMVCFLEHADEFLMLDGILMKRFSDEKHR